MKTHAKRQSGVAILEFALVLPVLLILTFITTEFGRALHQYSVVVKSARNAARYLTTQTPGTHQAEAVNLVVYGNTAGTGSALLHGLTSAHVQSPVWATTGVVPVINTVTIRVSGYTFQPMVPDAFGLPFGAITFPDITATMRSHL